METTVFALCLVVVMATGSLAQNSTIEFGSLPQANYTAENVPMPSSDSLSTLFSMATGFINVVFKPFSDLEDYISKLVTDASTFGTTWQEWERSLYVSMQKSENLPWSLLLHILFRFVVTFTSRTDWSAASLEAGYITCLVFGLLFVILVPLAGSIMCCCRCCCGKCGGRLEQSEKRSQSCYRQCLCGTMLILTTLMAIPTVFVFLTNEWVRDVVESTPAKSIAVINDMESYVDILPTQVNYLTAQYSTVDDNIRPLVQNFDVSIGIPLQQFVETESQDSMTALDETIKVVDDSTQAISSVDQSLADLETGMTTLNTSLNTLKSDMNTQLNQPDCASDPACFNVSVSTGVLSLGLDITQLSTLRSDLVPVNDSLNSFDVHAMKQEVQDQIDDIPSKVKSQTSSTSTDAVQALDDAKASVDGISDALPDFGPVKTALTNANNSVNNAIKFYDDNIDRYTYIGGVVLGSMLAVIVASYFIGLLLGVWGSDSKTPPDERGCGANCGGIMLMVGVGLSFIFSWLLMILVIVLFTVGGHGERYGCQSLEGPNYEGLVLIEGNVNLNLDEQLGLPDNVTLTLTDVLRSCEADSSAYDAFKLAYKFNVTAEVAKVSDSLQDIKAQTDSAVNDIDLSTISVYTKENQDDLLSLMNTGVDSVNYDDYLAELQKGITSADLTEYEAFLRNMADNLEPGAVAAGFDVTIRGFADRVATIQTTQVDPLQTDLDSLTLSIDVLMNASRDLNTTILQLDTSLTTFNDTIQTQGQVEIQTIVDGVYNEIEGNVTAYTDWITVQIEVELGKCRPFYQSYSELIGVFCDYFMDTVNGLWFSLGWAVFFLIPTAIVAMKMMKFYRQMAFGDGYEDTWDGVELGEYTSGSKSNEGAFY